MVAASQLQSRQMETVSDKGKFKVALLISQKQNQKVCVVCCSMYSVALWTRNILFGVSKRQRSWSWQVLKLSPVPLAVSSSSGSSVPLWMGVVAWDTLILSSRSGDCRVTQVRRASKTSALEDMGK